MNDSSLRIEVAIRAALIGKAALEMVNMDPRVARLQLAEVAKQLRDLDVKLEAAVRA